MLSIASFWAGSEHIFMFVKCLYSCDAAAIGLNYGYYCLLVEGFHSIVGPVHHVINRENDQHSFLGETCLPNGNDAACGGLNIH